MTDEPMNERGPTGPSAANGPSAAAAADPGGRGRFQRRRICAFCVDKVDKIDYKDINLLRRFVSDTGQIDSRRRTGTCARHQRRVTKAVKRARYLALLPYTAEHIRRYG